MKKHIKRRITWIIKYFAQCIRNFYRAVFNVCVLVSVSPFFDEYNLTDK